MKSIRVAVAAAAAGIALTACSSPTQAGAAAVVGNERISMSKVSEETEAFKAALKKLKLPENALGVPISHAVLERLLNVSALQQVMARHNTQVSETEIDAALRSSGEYQSPEINLLVNYVVPTDARDYGRAMAGQAKLMSQLGEQGLTQELGSIKPVISPRFGAFQSQLLAGAAAVVGNERISMSKVDQEAEAFKAALTKLKLPENALGVPISHAMLQRLVYVSTLQQVMARHNTQVSETEIDAALRSSGQYQSPEINLLANAVVPTDARDYGRAMAGQAKLLNQLGEQGLTQEFSSIKPVISPRFRAFNPQPGQENPPIFSDNGRFGKGTEQQQPQQQQG
ncbi:hypothetical protein ABZ897_44565 [Nonomuraea sp. NPDC046802]|uniref:hypothetical protein n=1 Tax=Nonomuraea sp. NPDC046802 TaxID=3154919 RepID=UPI0034040180